MRQPGPDHPISISRNLNRVRVTFAGKVIADTTKSLTLKEASYPPVQYIPRDDVDMTQLQRTEHSTHCPYKGDASYFSIGGKAGRGENAVWSYEAPYSAVAQIAGYLAFYPNRVDAVEELETRT
ncbi:MAG TPA: DUF427 domain-containing protein [Pseudolabrys sp.]|nr:DUF427 domain-containing protein [Pseudolabrys sp.]